MKIDTPVIVGALVGGGAYQFGKWWMFGIEPSVLEFLIIVPLALGMFATFVWLVRP